MENTKRVVKQMLKELYTAAIGMLPQQTRLEVIANNMSNASKPGFKRESVFERNLLDSRVIFFNVQGDAEQNDTSVGSYTDFSNGSNYQTDNPLDIALQGDGFFTVQDEEGKIFYTRNGRFTLNNTGDIVTPDGKFLISENGPLNIYGEYLSEKLITGQKNAADIKINENGEIFINDYSIGNLLLAQVNDLQTLQRISASAFIATEGTNVNYLSPEEILVKQGWLEESNVDIVREMVDMIELQRMFEAGSKVITTNEGTLGDSIRIGRFY